MAAERRLRIADTERTDDGYSGTLAIGAHPDGELAFEDGEAAVEAEVATEVAARYPNLELVGGDADVAAEATSDEPEEGDTTAPFDPAELTVDEVASRLEATDYSEAELDALADAEAADGSPRSTALDAIDDARDNEA